MENSSLLLLIFSGDVVGLAGRVVVVVVDFRIATKRTKKCVLCCMLYVVGCIRLYLGKYVVL